MSSSNVIPFSSSVESRLARLQKRGGNPDQLVTLKVPGGIELIVSLREAPELTRAIREAREARQSTATPA